jgi:hypothetical protein
MIEWLGDRRLSATDAGRALFATCDVVSPAALIEPTAGEPSVIPPVPQAISALLNGLAADPSRHFTRNAYPIYVPTPRVPREKLRISDLL